MAAVARYHLPEFADSSWDTVLFLTPYGIARNFISPGAITSFYGEISPGNAMLDTLRLATVGMLYLAAGINSLFLLLRLRDKP